MAERYIENWRDFGDNLRDYIKDNRDLLEENSYDLMLSFSRGGTILAFALACLLKDSEKGEYCKPFKASVRAIPTGIVVKKNNPCFVMDHPASDDEKKDILRNLQRELKLFSKDFNKGNPLNILIIDDNLTGATRIKYLDRLLAQIKNETHNLIGEHQMLGYVRHNMFNKLEIPTIRTFPENKDIFVMPWHDPHPTKELKFVHNNVNVAQFFITIKLNCHFESFIDNVETKCGIDYEYCNYFVRNGASNFFINKPEDTRRDSVDIYFKRNLLYPPKVCLYSTGDKRETSSDNSGIEFHELCDLVGYKNFDVCNICAYLNCNKKLIIDVFMAAANSNDISMNIVFLEKEDTLEKEKTNLKCGVEKWIDKWIISR